MLLGILGAGFLGYLLSRKGTLRAGYGKKKGKVIAKDIYGKQSDI